MCKQTISPFEGAVAMNTHCEIQTRFSFRDCREIRINFGGGRITSDAGLIGLCDHGLFQINPGKDQDKLLASQPSLSHFENSLCAREAAMLNELLVESFIQSCQRPANPAACLTSTSASGCLLSLRPNTNCPRRPGTRSDCHPACFPRRELYRAGD